MGHYDEQRYFIMMKGSVPSTKIRASEYVKEKEEKKKLVKLKGEIIKSPI